MNRWQRVGQWLINHEENIFRSIIPALTVLIAFFSLTLKISIFGFTYNQTIVLMLGFLAGNALIERFVTFKRIEKVLSSISHTQMSRIEKSVDSVALASVANRLGIVGITSCWTDFREFEPPFGERLKQQLEHSSAATWYVVTTSPQGLLGWGDQHFKKAIEHRKIDIKWVYHHPDVFKTSPAIRAQASMLFGQEPDWQVREQTLETEWKINIDLLKHMVSQSESRIRCGSKLDAGTWELYESTIPHCFLGFLSVPKTQQSISSVASAPDGTFGFVHLYPMFSKDYHDRPAIYFEAPGSFTDIYYRSILSMFDEHKNRGYIQRIHPPDKAGTV
jgi:hypothetical protein